MAKSENKPIINDANSSKKVNIGRIALNAIRKLQGKNGISLRELKKFLRDSKKVDIATYDADLKISLKKAMHSGILTKDGENFKVKEAKRRRSRSRSKRGKSTGRRRKRSSSGKRGRSRKKSGSKRKRSRSKRRRAAPAEEM